MHDDHPGDPASKTQHDRDALLAELLAELTDRLRRGGDPDVETLAGRHPELAEELRDLWAAASIAEEVAGALDRRPTPRRRPPSMRRPDPRRSRDGAESLFGGCELLEELGRGGMGVVYRARQPGLGRVVALKRLLRGDSALPHDVARFRAEAEAAARLDHPHIVPVYAVDVHAGEPFFLMKFIAGTTLAKRLAEGPMPAWEAAALLAPVCRAIHYAHEQGVLHRDLKPSNILIDGEGRPHVGDFGLAKRLDADASLTQSGAIIGTPSYMAPEQARAPAADGRRAIGPACDVYSLGAILYQMLTGRPPFQAATALDTILLVLEQDPVPPRVLNPQGQPRPRDGRAPVPAKGPRRALPERRRAGRRPRRLPCRPTGLGALDQPPRLAARLLGETHHAAILENWGVLWICHSIALVVFFGCHQRALVARCLGPLAVRPDLHRRPGCLGRLLLGPAAAGRADLVRRAPARPCLGRGGDRHQPHVPARVAPEAARPDAAARAGDHQRHALHDQGRHPLGRVLSLCGVGVSGDLPDGLVPPVRAA